jgi:hypothetical protein
MKLAVERNPAVGAAAAFIHSRQDSVEGLGVPVFRERRCLCGNRGLDDRAGMQHVEGIVRCDLV